MPTRNGMRIYPALIFSLFLAVATCLQTALAQAVTEWTTVDLHLSGDERIVLPASLEDIHSGTEQAGIGNYCVWLEQAESRQQKWQVHLSVPERGFVLHPVGHAGAPVPIEVSVQERPSSPLKRIQREMVISQGDELTSHCGSNGNRFRIVVKPTQALTSIRAGRYRQHLRLQLTSASMPAVDLTIQLLLDVPELVSATVESSTISLSPFDGRTASVGSTSLCLFRNGGGQYTVRLRGDGPGTQFSLKGAGLLDYRVFWQADSRIPEPLQPGRKSSSYSGSAFRDCRGTDNAAVQIEVPAHEAEKARSGRYRGNLRITVHAQ